MDTINKKQKVKPISTIFFTLKEIDELAYKSSIHYFKGRNSNYEKGFVNGFIEAQKLLNKYK